MAPKGTFQRLMARLTRVKRPSVFRRRAGKGTFQRERELPPKPYAERARSLKYLRRIRELLVAALVVSYVVSLGLVFLLAYLMAFDVVDIDLATLSWLGGVTIGELVGLLGLIIKGVFPVQEWEIG